MKKVILIVFTLMTFTSCGGGEYTRLSPHERGANYAFQDFSWSPDGTLAAVYSKGKMNIITPDGDKVGDEVSMNVSRFKEYRWYKENGSWRYSIGATLGDNQGQGKDSLKSEIGVEKQNRSGDNNSNIGLQEEFYQEVKLGENKIIYLSYSGEYFEVVRADLKEKDYVTVFRSTNILLGLNLYKGKIYFLGLNPRGENNRYTLYRASGEKVETISMH